MSTFSVPKGDPDALRRVVSGVATTAGAVSDTRGDRLVQLGASAERALPAARVAAFAGARADAATATGAVGVSLVTVASTLADWAEALGSAQDEIRHAASRYTSAETLWRRARAAADPDLTQRYHDDMVHETRRADRAQGALDDARRRAVSALSGAVDVWAPGGGSLAPVDAWQRAAVGALPSGMSLRAEQLQEAYRDPDVQFAKAAIENASKAALKGFQVYSVVSYLRAPALAFKAEVTYLERVARYQAIKGSAPDLSRFWERLRYTWAERRALQAMLKDNPPEVRQAQWLYQKARGLVGEAGALKQVQAKFPTLATNQIVAPVGRLGKLLEPLRAVSPFASKVLGPVGVVTGALDMYSAVTEDGLASDDRAARFVGGAASVVGGGATALMAFGVIATGPVGLTIVAVAGLVAVGAWAYENREAIGKAVSKAWDAVADGTQKVAGAVADGAQKVAGALADGATKIWKGLFG